MHVSTIKADLVHREKFNLILMIKKTYSKRKHLIEYQRLNIFKYCQIHHQEENQRWIITFTCNYGF